MIFDVLTLYPEAYSGLKCGIIGKALEKGLFRVNARNIRDYSTDRFGRCDDAPYGGGAGMVMTPQPGHDAILAVDPDHAAHRVYMSPKGRRFDQSAAKSLSKLDRILLFNGSYEGIDQRIIDLDIDAEISVGDYVITSGDLASMILINAVARYLPGVLGSELSVEEESFSSNLLEYPQYTRPQVFCGLAVPDVLLSGNHGEIKKWRAEKSLELTRRLRPDLLCGENAEP